MENVTTHSKAKLALAVFTSPAAAFEEIARRRLLGTALFITALTGAAAMAPCFVAARAGEPLQWLMLGKSNPIAWLGLCMLYVWAMQKLLKWLGSQVEYVDLLTLMGWSQLALLVSQIASTVLYAAQTEADKHQLLTNAAFAFYALGYIWYVVLAGIAINTLCRAPKARGMMTYMVVYAASAIAFSMTYANARTTPFQNALPGISATAKAIVSADQTPWLAGAVVGLVAGLLLIGKARQWPITKARLAAAGAGLLGLAAFAGYSYGVNQLDYYGRLMSANDAYINAHYAEAAKGLDSLLPITKDNLSLMLDVADVYYLAKDDAAALERLRKAEGILNEHESSTNKKVNATIQARFGMIYDAEGKYPEALVAFGKASTDWPELREPWVRTAVTQDRLGKYDKAIEAANHALKKLNSDATVAWVALAQAFAQTGDTTQQKAAIGMVVGRDKRLAEKIESSAGGWKGAVSMLNREDLKFPLEHELAPEPKKPAKPKKK